MALGSSAFTGLAAGLAPSLAWAATGAGDAALPAGLEQVRQRAEEGTRALRENRLEEAVRILGEVIATNGVPPELLAASHYHRGIAHQKLGHFNEATADYTAALWLEALPDHVRARAYYNRGTALDNLGQHQRARKDFDRAIALAPDFAPAYNNRANVLRRMGEYEAAIADYDASIALGNPLPHLPHYGRAVARRALGDIAGARADLERAVALAPDYAPARQALAALPTPASPVVAAAQPLPVKAGSDGAAAAATPQDPIRTATLPRIDEAAGKAGATAPAPMARAVPTPAPRPDRTAATDFRFPDAAAATTPRGTGPARRAAVPPREALAITQRGQANPAKTALGGPGIAPLVTGSNPSGPASAEPASAKPAPSAGDAAIPKARLGAWTTLVRRADGTPVKLAAASAPAPALRPTAANDELREGEAKRGVAAPDALAALSPQPVAGLDFPGVPAERYRHTPAAAGTDKTSGASSGTSATQQLALAPAPAPVRARGRYAVQIASVGSPEEAARAWAAALARHGALLAGRPHFVERAEIAGRGTFYRVRVGPLAQAGAAKALCRSLKAAGQDCYVATR